MNIIFLTDYKEREGKSKEVYNLDGLQNPPYYYYGENSLAVELIKVDRQAETIYVCNYMSGIHKDNSDNLQKASEDVNNRVLFDELLNGEYFLLDINKLKVVYNFETKMYDEKLFTYLPPARCGETVLAIDGKGNPVFIATNSGVHTACFIDRFISNGLLESPLLSKPNVIVEFIANYFSLDSVASHILNSMKLKADKKLNLPEECLVKLRELNKKVTKEKENPEGKVLLSDIRDKKVDPTKVNGMVQVEMDFPISGIKSVKIYKRKLEFYRNISEVLDEKLLATIPVGNYSMIQIG
jgi:hypothetical protein